MNKMLRLEDNITGLGVGEFLFIGYGYDIDEMQNILLFLKDLETKQILQIVYQHTERETGKHLTDIIKIQKC
ncbi:hypothetical protein LF296_07960 [Acinetobacter vivianii]|uniref:Uncharacterized protein n=1 Tax=Acinetobacter vivianii TaxID=1776742 RepID=A0AAJ6P6Q3_9GAMM|nr:hypothetical protein [Acinetobacter vivianii]WDZ52701.1 hypothetical protein LF296_07960 [Acinetobacter vivianii]